MGPREPMPRSAIDEEVRVDPETVPRGATARPRILIVEDELIIAWQLGEIIRDLGYEVCGTAADSAAAQRLAAELQPDAVLMDVRLRAGDDGGAAAAAIMAERPVPVLFCTAFADDPAIRRRLEPLAAAILAKPIRPDSLQTALERALGRDA
jgi:CheY-like chemotaxis protein